VNRSSQSEPLLSSAYGDPNDYYCDNTMAVSMENPQDPEHVHFAASPTTQQLLEEDKHASKYPKKHRQRLRHYLRQTATQFRWNARNMTALGLSVIMTVLICHRLISLYMSSRRWINAPITYMPRQCSGANYATILRPEEAGKVCVTTLTDARKYSTLQRFLRWRNFDGILELTWHNKWEYCQRHGYHFYDGSDHIDKSRPPAWSKIKAVQHLLEHEQCDWVLWTDADTVVMNSERLIEEFLPADPTKDLLVGSDKGGGYNSGVFVVRNTAWSRRFLQEWWDMESYVNPPGLSLSGDNHALKALLAHMVDFDAHVLSPARCTFNSFAKFLALSESAAVMDSLDEQPWYGSEDYYHKGDFLAHSPGYDNKEQVLRLLLQEAE